MAESTEKAKVAVNIYGEEYIVKANTEPEYIMKIASVVDERLKELNRLYPRLNLQRLAILTAINLADEVEKLKKENSDLRSLMEELGG